MRKYCCIQVRARSEYCCKRSAGMREDAVAGAGSSGKAAGWTKDNAAEMSLEEACPTGFNRATNPSRATCRRSRFWKIPETSLDRDSARRRTFSGLLCPKVLLPYTSFELCLCTQFLYQVCQNYHAGIPPAILPARSRGTMSLDIK